MKAEVGLPDRVETILLDAGGVLLDLDYAYLKRLIEARHVAVELSALSHAEVQARGEIQRHVAAGGRVGEVWRDYFHTLLHEVGVPVELQSGMIDSLWEAHERVGLWTVAIDGGPAAVRELKSRGYALAVVSNAEGRVAQDLDCAGYAELFDAVVDSHLVGVEKPDPQIFRIALERLDASPETTIFVGDVPSVDVAGAQNAGLAPILIDRHGLFEDLSVDRLPSIGALPAWLQQHGHR